MSAAEEPVSRTVSAQIRVRIREKILSGAYAPGSQLLQDSIAAEFGTSKIPVREALLQLRSEGLVDIFAHRGFQVRPLARAEVAEVFRLRLDIEPQAAAKGARTARDEDRSATHTALSALNAALAAGALGNAGDLNCSFHLALIVPRVNPVTSEVLYRLHTLSQRYVRLHLQGAGRVRRAAREHAAIYKVWAEQDAEATRRLVRAHIEETRDELQESFSDSP
ncbi:MAG TPA: GntR family transcriptional regulator [Candidatus Dormibacteraeota bacterium]|nr:GntR family transcriptional regulator [Candidatus Dormibacteraeota bacterium]